MSDLPEDRFSNELRVARERLTALGRPTDHLGMIDGEGGLHSNLELPYSTMPKLNGQRWKKTELIA